MSSASDPTGSIAVADVLLYLTLGSQQLAVYERGIRDAFPHVRLRVARDAGEAQNALGEVDGLIAFAPTVASLKLADARRLRWIQALGTGVDGVVDHPSLPPDTVVTNVRGIHGPAMAEAAIAAMLSFARQLPRVVENQQRRDWQRWPATTLHGSTVAVIGVGAIAEYLAPLCSAFGMRVLGVSSSPRPVAGFDRVLPRHEIDLALSAADFVVILAPGTRENDRLVDAGRIASMKPTACLVNLGRGSVVDEGALVDALRQKRIAGAVLDVFQSEPLPKDHALWDLQNVLITPHIGGMFSAYPQRAMPTILQNLSAFLAGEPDRMINRVHTT